MAWICKAGGESSRVGPRPCPAATERHPSPPSPLAHVQEEEGEGEVASAPLRWRLQPSPTRDTLRLPAAAN
jgi:hypothetical protein